MIIYFQLKDTAKENWFLILKKKEFLIVMKNFTSTENIRKIFQPTEYLLSWQISEWLQASC